MSALVSHPSQAKPDDQLAKAVASTRSGFVGVALFTIAINILALTGAIYMLQLYDRVLASHSVQTLIGITVIMIFLYAVLGGFDLLRMRILSRLGVKIERCLREQVIVAVMLKPLQSGAPGDSLAPVRDLDQVRKFLSGLGPTALFDLPWIPFYLAVVYYLHPSLGLLAIVGAVVLIALSVLTEVSSRAPSRAINGTASVRNSLGEAIHRNAEAIHANGMGPRLSWKWASLNEAHLSQQVGGGDIAAQYGSMTKVLRMMLQSLVLGLGAYLVIQAEVTVGVMTAASLLVARALAPVELAIANWRGFIASRQSWERLREALALTPSTGQTIELPAPQEQLQATDLWVVAPGKKNPILKNVSMEVFAGDGLGIIGSSASGKSTLVRALVGIWRAQKGVVRLDGAALDQWQSADLGRYIGYLPQDVELFAGTVAENIARFDPEASSEETIAAAREAGVHNMILALPQGYQTQIGEAGAALSSGQRQRIGLARALYGNPFLVVLDEPNSNLDAAGDAALSEAIASVRDRKGIVVVVAHRPSALSALNKLMVLADGRVKEFGAKKDVLRKSVKAVSSSANDDDRTDKVLKTTAVVGN